MALNIKDVINDENKRLGDCRNAMASLIRKIILEYGFTLPQFDKLINNYVDCIMRDQGITSQVMRSQNRANFSKSLTSPTTTDKTLDKFIRMLAVSQELDIESAEISIKIKDGKGKEISVSTDLYRRQVDK
jgi:hypothetical protein